MHTVPTIAGLAGLVSGLFAGWIWREVSSRLRSGDFWKQVQITAQSLLSTDEDNQFLKHYLKLLPLLFKYLGTSLLTLLLSVLPVLTGFELLKPWAERVWLSHSTQLDVHTTQPMTLKSAGREFEIRPPSTKIASAELDLSKAAELECPPGSFHCESLQPKQAWAPSLWKRMWWNSLGFQELRPSLRVEGGKLPQLLLRPSSGDTNFCWPLLNDWEFCFLVLLTLGSIGSMMIPRRRRAA